MPGITAAVRRIGTERVWTGASFGDHFLVWLSAVLLGYALLGRGFAYLGIPSVAVAIPPIFIGEVTLGLGLIALALSRSFLEVLRLPAAILLLLLMAWGGIRTVPYIGTYGVMALRDAVMWGYGTFSFVVAATLIARPIRLLRLLRHYHYFAFVFLALAPVVWTLANIYDPFLPTWKESGVTIPDAKPGDILVHLAGIAAFLIIGIGRAPGIWFVLLAGTTIVVGLQNRGGLVAFIACISLVAYFTPLSRRLWRLGVVGVACVAFLALSGLEIEVFRRTISWEQIITNIESTLFDSGEKHLDNTKKWRLRWWGTIVGYTLEGRYFWTGKGFGINLADSDGFQVRADKSLRSPHNGHLTFLARAGVPGLLLWSATQLAWAWGVAAAYVRARRRGERNWPRLFAFLLAFWLAFTVNGAFDVYLEGPVGGIWFWTIFGLGLATLSIHRSRPEILEPPPAR